MPADGAAAARSLTETEARQRAADLQVQRMLVRLDLDRGPETFRSSTTISVQARRRTDTFLDVRPQALHSLSVDGVDLDPELLASGRYPLVLEPGAHEVRAVADMAYSHDGEGLHRTVDPADDRAYTYLMSFMDAAPRCFACFDQPDLKSRYRIAVRAPADWSVLGNTRATRSDDGWWELAESLPLSTYHVTVVAGPWHSVTREHDGIRLGLHTKQSLAVALNDDADELFEVTGQSLDALHERFGIRYPFGDYHQAFVPEFNAGAMECPGCVLFRDGLVFRSAVTDAERGVRVNVVVHEMAHMWFGNIVTPRWWDDLWLNESFAEYIGYRVGQEATRFDGAWVDFAYSRKRWGMVADQRPSTHPVASNGAADARTALSDFDGISYAKGAALLKQLAAYLGDDVFFAGVREHLEAHAYGNATLSDLLDAWERAADRAGQGQLDVHAWAKAWLRTTGADTLRVEGAELVRTAPAGGHAAGVERPHRFALSRVSLADATAETREVVVAADRTPLPVTSGPGYALVLDTRDDAWAKLRTDASTHAALPDLLPRLDDPVTRGAVWLAVRDGFDDAELDPSWVLDLLCTALPHEDSDIAVRSLLGWAEVSLLGSVYGGSHEAADQLTAAVQARLRTAVPGSSLQLAAARGLVTVTRDTQLVADWLAGRSPAGIAVDTELRWHLLTQLCRRGAAGRADLDAETRRDRSTEGHVHATRCRAALPDAEAKTEAWRVLTTEPQASNYELYAIGDGFWWPEQHDLLAPYVPRFFADVPATARLRSGWVVAETVRTAFPKYSVDSETLGLADGVVGDTDVDPAVRREVGDSADAVRRALRIRERWLG